MLGRMWGMLKVAGDPVPYCGISGINVTSRKVFAAALAGRRGGVGRERAGDDSECRALSVSAAGGVWDLCCGAQGLAG